MTELMIIILNVIIMIIGDAPLLTRRAARGSAPRTCLRRAISSEVANNVANSISRIRLVTPWKTNEAVRPISLTLSLLRLLDSNFPGNPLWT